MLFKLLVHLIQTNYWSHQKISKVRKMQIRKFNELFQYAKSNSKFYNELYASAGLSDFVITKESDIRKIPIVTKEMLRNCPLEDLLTEKFNPKLMNVHSTSGSSGNPFRVVYDKWVDYSAHVRLTWALIKCGYTPFKKMTLLSRYDKTSKFEVEDDISLISKLQKRLHIFERDIISIFEDPKDIIKSLEIQKPFVVWTTPSAVRVVSKELQKQGKRLSVPLLLLMSETYNEEDIKLFKDYLCINIVDAYGCMELPCMGYGYNQNRFKKLIPNFVFAEVLNKRNINNDYVGDYVVTNLINKTMPIIRYALGDFVEILDSDEFPNIKIGKVHGRIDDIITHERESITFHTIYQLFRDFHSVEQYKLYQYKSGKIEFRIILARGVKSEETIAEVYDRWNKYYSQIPLDVVVVDKLPIDHKTGKFKVIEKEK